MRWRMLPLYLSVAVVLTGITFIGSLLTALLGFMFGATLRFPWGDGVSYTLLLAGVVGLGVVDLAAVIATKGFTVLACDREREIGIPTKHRSTKQAVGSASMILVLLYFAVFEKMGVARSSAVDLTGNPVAYIATVSLLTVLLVAAALHILYRVRKYARTQKNG